MRQDSYIDGLVPIRTDDLPTSGSFNSTQIRRVRGLVGQLQWAAKLTRPDISFSSCNLSSRAKDATMIEVKEANKLLKKLKQQQYKICIPNIGNIVEASLVVFSDASHKILADGNSQGGFIVFLKGINEKFSPLVWTSHRLKRVVKSAMAAETMALLEATEHAMLLKSVLLDIYNINDTSCFPISCFIDSKQTHDAVTSTNVIEDKRTLIDVCAIRQMLEKGEIAAVNWISKDKQLADPLTKCTASSELLIQVLSGDFQIPLQ